MADERRGFGAFLGWMVALVVGLSLVAAFFGFNLDEVAKYQYYKLTYKVSENSSAGDFSAYSSRSSGSLKVSTDIRVFTLYAFLEGVGGYDVEYAASKSPERRQLEDDIGSRLASIAASKVKVWKDYYKAHPYNVYKYLYYVLALGKPPEFEYITPKGDISEKDFFMLGGFRRLLGDFYEAAGIEELYAWHRDAGFFDTSKEYDLAVMPEQQKFVHKYLRIDTTRAGRTNLTVIPMPYESHYVAYSVKHGDSAYIVEGPDASDGNLNWHEYLHAFVDTVVDNSIWPYRSKFEKAFEANRQKPGVKGNYETLDSFVTECVIRPLDHSIQVAYAQTWAKDALRKKLNEVEKEELLNGFALIPYFSSLLQGYATDGALDFTSFLKKAFSDYVQ